MSLICQKVFDILSNLIIPRVQIDNREEKKITTTVTDNIEKLIFFCSKPIKYKNKMSDYIEIAVTIHDI